MNKTFIYGFLLEKSNSGDNETAVPYLIKFMKQTRSLHSQFHYTFKPHQA